MPEVPDPPVRTCIGCGKSDTDPKHGIALDPWTTIYHHIECGPLMDPECGTADQDMRVCAPLLVGWNGARGDGLREHLRGLGKPQAKKTKKAGA